MDSGPYGPTSTVRESCLSEMRAVRGGQALTYCLGKDAQARLGAAPGAPVLRFGRSVPKPFLVLAKRARALGRSPIETIGPLVRSGAKTLGGCSGERG